MNSVGRMNRISGTVMIAGRRAAFSSARIIRSFRNSAERTRSADASGVPVPGVNVMAYLPGADSILRYWDNLRSGRSAIRRLTEAGALAGRRLVLDRAALGFGVTVFLGVKLGTKGRVSLADFERAVSAIPEVQTAEHVLGLYDYRLRVAARDIADFERVLRRRIMTLPGVANVDANVLLSEERLSGPI